MIHLCKWPVIVLLLPAIHATAQTDTSTQKTRSLREITVTAIRPFIQKSFGKTIIHLENSILAQGTSGYELLDKLPGVQLNQDGVLSMSGKADVAIYIDGKPTGLSGADLNNLLKGMLSNSIERIELISHPSARYEAAGSGGIINIIRKKNKQTGFNGNAGIGYGRGAYGRSNGTLNLSYRNSRYNGFFNNTYTSEKTALHSAALSEFISNGHITGSYDARNEHLRNMHTWLPAAGVEFYLSPRTSLSVTGNAQLQQFRTQSNAYTNIFDAAGQWQQQLTFQNQLQEPARSYSGSVHFSHQADSSGKEFTADLDYADYYNRSDQHIMNAGQGNPIPVFLDQYSRLHIYAVKADYTHPLKAGGRVELGWKTSYVDTRNDSRFFEKEIPDPAKGNYFKYSEQINAAYASIQKTHQRLSWQLGARVEQTIGHGKQVLTQQHVDRNYWQLFPSAQVSFQFNDDHSLSWNAARKVDRPAYATLNPLFRFVNSTAYIQGDPNLQPQLSYSTALKYAYHNQLFFTLGYTYYTHYITYWIFPQTDPVNGTEKVIVSKPVNLDHATAYNAELLYTQQICAGWTSSNSVTLYYNQYQGTVNNYQLHNQGIPSFFFNTQHSFVITPRISAEASFRYAHRSQEGTVIYKPNSNFSAGIKTSLLGNKGALSLNVSDLFRGQRFIWTSDVGGVLESRHVQLDARVIRLNFTYKFGSIHLRKIKTGAATTTEKSRAEDR